MYVNENYAKQHLHLIAKLVYHSIVSSRIGAGVQIKNKRKKKKTKRSGRLYNKGNHL